MRRLLFAASLALVGVILTLAWASGPAGSAPVVAGRAAARPATAPSETMTYTQYLPLITLDSTRQPYVLKVIQLPAGSHPHGIALDVDRQRAFVGNQWANTLSVIDTAAGSVSATIPLPNATGPNGVAYHAGLDRVYVANRDSNNLSIVDPTQGSLVSTQNVGYLPDGVAVLGDLVYVANFGANTVSILDAQLNAVTRTLDIGSEPSHFAVLAEYATVYLTSHGNDQIYMLKAAAYDNSSYGNSAPYGITIDPITYRLYVANRGEAHTVTLLDVNPNQVMGTLDVGREPYVLAINPRTGHLFVVCGDVVNVYDRRDNALVTSIPVGVGATEGIAVDPARNLVYVTSSDVDQVTVIQDIPTFDLAYVTYRLSPNQLPQSDIVIMDDTGRHVKQLTQAVGDLDLNAQPVFQPSGKRLVFASARNPDHGWDVFTMELTGHNQVNLTDDGGEDNQEPAWSPDGTQIAWRRDWSIWVMNADGSNKRQLTNGPHARTPRWSPDGNWICFIAWPPGEMQYVDVYIVAASGGTPIDVTNHPRNDLQASWSPDSRAIAFETDRHSVFSNTHEITANWEIYAVDISTTAQTRLTDDPDQDHLAAWSPDGTQIAWVSDRGNDQYNYSAWVMLAGGSLARRLTPPLHLAGSIAWAPDGRRLSLATTGSLNGDIYVVDVASGRLDLITTPASQGAAPTWRPDTWH